MDQKETGLGDPERFSRLTALWALTEVSLGGLMHAMRIPLNGLFVGGTALLCLFLMSRHTKRPIDLIRAFAIVAVVKAVGSPHASPFAYVAMAVQTLCCLPMTGRLGRSKMVVAVLLGLAVMYSPAQRLIIIWATLGSQGTEALLQWAQGIATTLGLPAESIGLALAAYFGLYAMSGVVVVSLAWRWMRGLPEDKDLHRAWSASLREEPDAAISEPIRKPPLSPWLTPALLVVACALTMAMGSADVWASVLLRPTLVVLVWMAIVRPVLSWVIRRRAEQFQHGRTDMLKSVKSLFPNLRHLVEFSWRESGGASLWRRPGQFLSVLFTILMHSRLSHD